MTKSEFRASFQARPPSPKHKKAGNHYIIKQEDPLFQILYFKTVIFKAIKLVGSYI